MILMQVDPLAAADKIPKSRDELLVWGCGIFILLMVGIIVTGGKFILSQVTKLQDETFAMAERFSNEIQKSRADFLIEQEKGRVFHACQMKEMHEEHQSTVDRLIRAYESRSNS